MMSKETGGPAFPTDNAHQNGPSTFHFEGMTLRDYFAAKAMMEFISAQDIGQAYFKKEAEAAYRVADSMLKARDAE